jgi:hypothetical protein
MVDVHSKSYFAEMLNSQLPTRISLDAVCRFVFPVVRNKVRCQTHVSPIQQSHPSFAS